MRPKAGASIGFFGGNARTQTITDIAFVNGNVIVAGLSNEEWSSALRSIPYPFTQAAKGATVQIWHASHGDFETEAPVRTFVPYTIQGQQYILAAYTCTPLVKIPVSDLKPGAQVKGTTIADLGSGNRPLDMIPYQKGGHDYILIANSSNGIQKLQADNLETYKRDHLADRDGRWRRAVPEDRPAPGRRAPRAARRCECAGRHGQRIEHGSARHRAAVSCSRVKQ